jgi:hypothetical protein
LDSLESFADTTSPVFPERVNAQHVRDGNSFRMKNPIGQKMSPSPEYLLD